MIQSKISIISYIFLKKKIHVVDDSSSSTCILWIQKFKFSQYSNEKGEIYFSSSLIEMKLFYIMPPPKQLIFLVLVPMKSPEMKLIKDLLSIKVLKLLMMGSWLTYFTFNKV